MKNLKMSKGQIFVLMLALLPMAAIGVAGAVATYVNMDAVLHRSASALGLVAAGEGATLICALVALAVTLMGQHTPAVVRLGMWAVPLLAAGVGYLLAPTLNDRVTMTVTPLAMTAAGEGIAFVARRVVAFRTDTDLEQQRRSGLLLWHANRAANGSRLGKYLSRSAVWRLTKAFAATDGQLNVQIGAVLRDKITRGADENLGAVLTRLDNAPVRPAVAPAVPAPALAPVEAPEPVSEAHSGPADDGYDFIKSVLAEGEANVLASAPAVTLLTGDDVAVRLNVKPATVRTWVARGRLRIHDRDEDGRSLFHPDDVAKLG